MGFTNIRSLLNFSIIKQKLHETMANLLEELKQLFINNVNQLLISMFNKFDLIETLGRKRGEFNLDGLLNVFQQQVSGVSNKTQEQLNRNLDDAIDFVLTYWNDFQDRLVGYIFEFNQIKNAF